MASPEWYYAKNDTQYGPVSAAELKRLADRGQLKPGDLVWRKGMEEWVEAKKLKRLFEGAPAPPSNAPEAPPKTAPEERAAPFGESAAAFEPSRRRPSRHLFDLLLQLARGQFTTQFIELTSKIFTGGGHYGLYLAVVVLLALTLILGVKTSEVNTILLGMAGVVILIVLQYTASRYFGALEKLNQANPNRMSSTAFLDCFALLHMVGGLVVLLGLSVIAVQRGLFLLVVPAVATFILFQYVAALALNPQTLNITIASETTAGEEALGIFALFVKLTLRIVPVAFGVGIAAGVIMLLYAVLMIFIPVEMSSEMVGAVGSGGGETSAALAASGIAEKMIEMWPAKVTASAAAAVLMTSAALPFFTYLLFLSCFLLIDVIRAVLLLPGKLDTLLVEGEEEED